MRRLLKFLGVLVGGLVLILVAVALINPAPPDPAKRAQAVFGVAKGNRDSGLVQVTIAENEAVLHYRFFPAGLAEFEKELGVDLAPKLRRFFREVKAVRYATVLVLAPYEAGGSIAWMPKLSFQIAGSSLAEAGADFQDSMLLSLAYGIERFR